MGCLLSKLHGNTEEGIVYYVNFPPEKDDPDFGIFNKSYGSNKTSNPIDI